jgi:hypothetical protein
MRRSRNLSAILIICLLSAVSCQKSDDSHEYSYYVSKKLSLTLDISYINNLLDYTSASVPEIKNIKPLISSSVSVYKVVYKTTLNGSTINASGLVCIPVNPGEYPVYSFQNGTNTVNASAPSQLPSDFSYQLVEAIAATGCIVVIADYPGFGESAGLTHPYLIAEPTVRSLVDMLFAAKELVQYELPGVKLKNEYYLSGYSQGGWATLALHKALEKDYVNEFNLRGSACGAGPYDMMMLFSGIVNTASYPMPSYLGYIINAYSYYHQFSNPVSDILKEPYATKLSSLYNGTLSLDQINSQLTTSIPDLFNSDFLSGFTASAKYASVRQALNNNSISAWKSSKPLLLLHGGSDSQVSPNSTENMYNAMIQAGTSPDLCSKSIIPGYDHSDGAVPCLLQGLIFLKNLESSD